MKIFVYILFMLAICSQAFAQKENERKSEKPAQKKQNIYSNIYEREKDMQARIDEINLKLIKLEYYEALRLIYSYLSVYPNDPEMFRITAMIKYMMQDVQGSRRDIQYYRKISPTGKEDPLENFLSREYLAKSASEGYIDENVKLLRENNYRPPVTRSDSLLGAMRPERTCFDVYFYDLRVKVFPDDKKISGRNQINFLIRENTNRIQLDLAEQFTIDSIVMDSKHLSYKRDCGALFIELPETLEPGFDKEITIGYSGKPRIAVNPPWNGGFVWETDHSGKHWVGVACEHLGASSWWPVKDHLSDKPDSMRITISVPGEYKAISNGNLRSVKDSEMKYKDYEWFVSYPINSYNVTLYMGNFIQFSDTVKNANGKYPIDFYVLKKHKKKAVGYYSKTREIIGIFEKLYGEYPFKKDGAGMVEAPFAGMEHQGAIAIGDRYGKEFQKSYSKFGFDYLLVHETAHEWWGNAVAIGDFADAWINEGFTTYTEMLLAEQVGGHTEYINSMAETMMSVLNVWPLIGKRDINDNSFLGGDIYSKGACLLHNLRCSINNDSLFLMILRDYYQKYLYRITCTDDFISLVNEYTRTDYTALFKKFLYSSEPPVLEYQFANNGGNLSFAYRWVQVDKGFTMPFCLTLNGKTCVRLEGTTEFRHYTAGGIDSFYIPTAFRFDPIIIPPCSFTYFWTSWDPDGKMLGIE